MPAGHDCVLINQEREASFAGNRLLLPIYMCHAGATTVPMTCWKEFNLKRR